MFMYRMIMVLLNASYFCYSTVNGDSDLSSEAPEPGDIGEFKCDQCPRSFQWKSNLIRHQVLFSASSFLSFSQIH